MKLVLTYILCGLFLIVSLGAFAKDKAELKESYGITLRNMEVLLDNHKQVVNIDVQWDYKNNPGKDDYIDSNLIVADIKNFLKQYPTPKDYWEIINHNLSLFLVNKYKQIDKLLVKVEIPPTKTDNYVHYSTVKAATD